MNDDCINPLRDSISKQTRNSVSLIFRQEEQRGVVVLLQFKGGFMEDNYRYFQYYFQCYCGKCFSNHEELMKHQMNEHKLNNEREGTEIYKG